MAFLLPSTTTYLLVQTVDPSLHFLAVSFSCKCEADLAKASTKFVGSNITQQKNCRPSYLFSVRVCVCSWHCVTNAYTYRHNVSFLWHEIVLEALFPFYIFFSRSKVRLG